MGWSKTTCGCGRPIRVDIPPGRHYHPCEDHPTKAVYCDPKDNGLRVVQMESCEHGGVFRGKLSKGGCVE